MGLAACGDEDDSTTASTADSSTGSAATGTGGTTRGERSPAGIGGGPGAPPKATTAHPRPRRQGPPGRPLHRTYPGDIIGHRLAEGGPIQPEELWPVTNGWQISDHRTLTGVYAGADPRDRSTGRLVVFRQDFIHVTQTSDRVDVPRAGPLEITAAPHGASFQSSAQQSGELRFRGERGVTGTLHLGNDSVTVSR